jgi:hypothetical protein
VFLVHGHRLVIVITALPSLVPPPLTILVLLAPVFVMLATMALSNTSMEVLAAAFLVEVITFGVLLVMVKCVLAYHVWVVLAMLEMMEIASVVLDSLELSLILQDLYLGVLLVLLISGQMLELTSPV